MRNLVCTKYLEDKLLDNKWTIENGVFIKRRKNTANIETIRIIDKNLAKINREYYAIISYLYYRNSDFKVQAFGSTYYADYHDFKDLYQKNIDKRQILNEVIEAVIGLQNIGIDYLDIHARNIIVKDNHIRLVDLDEAYFSKYANPKARLLLNLIVESIIFYDISDNIWEYLDVLLLTNKLASRESLSDSFKCALKGAISDSQFYSKADAFIGELMNEEVNAIIRKELKDNYPKLYI